MTTFNPEKLVVTVLSIQVNKPHSLLWWPSRGAALNSYFGIRTAVFTDDASADVYDALNDDSFIVIRSPRNTPTNAEFDKAAAIRSALAALSVIERPDIVIIADADTILGKTDVAAMLLPVINGLAYPISDRSVSVLRGHPDLSGTLCVPFDLLVEHLPPDGLYTGWGFEDVHLLYSIFLKSPDCRFCEVEPSDTHVVAHPRALRADFIRSRDKNSATLNAIHQANLISTEEGISTRAALAFDKAYRHFTN